MDRRDGAVMHEGSVETEKRIAAWRALREAKAVMEEMIAEAVRMSDTLPGYNKLKKWLPAIAAAEKDIGNVIADLDPLARVMEIRQIAAKLRHWVNVRRMRSLLSLSVQTVCSWTPNPRGSSGAPPAGSPSLKAACSAFWLMCVIN
jgi:hypothetical protein